MGLLSRLKIGSPLSDYEYSPLDNNQIRLVAIQPGTKDAPIVCNIQKYRYQDIRGRYEALSYTWGDMRRPKSIFIDGKTSHLQVTKNCVSAIKRLRLADQPRSVWIDAICINQHDIQERNAQVAIMGNIYQQASQVIIYLGEADDTSNVGMGLLKRIEAKSVQHDQSLTNKESTALHSLLGRPWFSRMWVLQETFMAKKAFVYCGPDSVSWDSIQILRNFDRLSPRGIAKWPFVTTVRDKSKYFTKTHLLELLEDTRLVLSTDPRDKIFALIPMLSDSFELGLQANYELSASQVFISIAKLLARFDTAFLGLGQGSSAVFDLPSWVPDWAVPLNHNRVFWRVATPPFYDACNKLGFSTVDGFYQEHQDWRSHQGNATHVVASARGESFPILRVKGLTLGRINALHDTVDMRQRSAIDIIAEWDKIAKDYPLRDIPSFGILSPEHENSIRQYFPELDDEVAYTIKNRRFFTTTDGFFGVAPESARMDDHAYILVDGPAPYIFREIRTTEGVLECSFIGDSWIAGVMNGHFARGSLQDIAIH